MKQNTIFQHSKEFKDRLKAASLATGMNLSELIRRAVDKYLKELGL